MKRTTPSIPATYDELKVAHLDLLGKYEQILHELSWMKRQMFGQKSEHFIPLNNGQQALELDTAHGPAPAPATESITYDRTVPQKEKNGHGRSPLPAHLPRVDVVIEPTEDVTGCERIGEEITEELECVPGKLFVRRFIRPKYAKPGADGSTVITGVLPYRPIEKGRPGPGLLAQVHISKYVDHLPLYRQEKIFGRQGVHLARSVMVGWIHDGNKLLLPVYELLKSRVLSSDYIQVDETPIQVQDENVKDKTHRGYLFVYHSPLLKAVVFEYREGRGRAGPEEFLKTFTGYLQADGYSGYDQLMGMPRIIGMGCWAHARRYFFDAKESDPEYAEQALQRIGLLYAAEEVAREKGMTHDERLRLRREKSVPVLTEFKAWLDASRNAVLPKSPTGEAITYALNNWERLQVYTTDGRLEIDNNLVENAIRPVALGRKNWLFAGSHEGAQRAAVIYSLVCTCKMNDIEPFETLRNLFDKLPGYPVSRIAELLPINRS